MVPATIGVLVLSLIAFFIGILSARNAAKKKKDIAEQLRSTKVKARNDSESLGLNEDNPEAMKMAAGGKANDEYPSARARRTLATVGRNPR